MDLPTLSAKIVNDTNSLINNLNAADNKHTYELVTKPIGEIDGLDYHCVVVSAGRSLYLKKTPWQRVVDSVIVWANRYGNERMVVYYLDMDSQENPLVRIGTLAEPPEDVFDCPLLDEINERNENNP